MMKETGIIMSGSHPVDILEGRKTMTRRLWELAEINENPDDWELVAVFQDGLARFGKRDGSQELTVKCPYGGYGDRLWVKETFAYVWPKEHPEGWTDDGHGGERALEKEECNIEYKADTGNPYPGYWPPELKDDEACGRWKSSLFMPRKASRILLEITEVRAERLQEITEEDVIAEGIPRYTFARGCASTNPPDPRWKFIELWDSLNAKRGYGWDKNNWVWVIAFKRLERA